MKTLDILKQLAASKTIWGVLILLLNATVLKDSPLTEGMGDEASNILENIVNVVGTVLAFWGRLTARGPIITPSA
jgi:hypothetical protein